MNETAHTRVDHDMLLPILALAASSAPSAPPPQMSTEIDLTSTVPAITYDGTELMPRLGARALFTVARGPFLDVAVGGAVEAGQTLVNESFVFDYGGYYYSEQGARALALASASLPILDAGPLEIAPFLTLGAGLDAAEIPGAFAMTPVVATLGGLRADVDTGGPRVGLFAGVDIAWIFGRSDLADQTGDLVGGLTLRF